MFLAKTWLDISRLDGICENLQMGHKHGVAKVNQGGGLALLWKQDIDIRVDDSSPNYINAIFNSGKENS